MKQPHNIHSGVTTSIMDAMAALQALCCDGLPTLRDSLTARKLPLPAGLKRDVPSQELQQMYRWKTYFQRKATHLHLLR